MVRVLEALGVEATTGHWEFTLGHERITELFGDIDSPARAKLTFLAGNIRENEFDEPVFKRPRMFEKRRRRRSPSSARRSRSRRSPTRAG